MDVANGFREIRLGQRFGVIFDVAVAVALQGFHRALMDAFEQQNFDFVFVERSGGQILL